ncbi:MAG: hypothetical protein OXF74_00065 [Rhodobacteraceae bacterium]|nr:hypothetical protein [Paracoccaceae bacterium]
MILVEEQCVEDLADLLYEFPPGSGNSWTAFPLDTAQVQTKNLRIGGCKRPTAVHLLSSTLNHRRHKFAPLVLAIARQSMTWERGKGNPLTRLEIDDLNQLLPRLSLNIPDIHCPAFPETLAVDDA